MNSEPGGAVDVGGGAVVGKHGGGAEAGVEEKEKALKQLQLAAELWFNYFRVTPLVYSEQLGSTVPTQLSLSLRTLRARDPY